MEPTAQETHLRTMLRFAMDGACLVGETGRILEANEAYCRMLGYTREELIGRSVGEFDAAETEEATRAHIRDLVRAGSCRFEARHVRRDGTLLPVEVSTTFIPELRQFVAYIRDITGKLDQEAQADRWRQTFAVAGLPLAHVDHASDRLLEVNRAFAQARGYQAWEMVDMPVGRLLDPAWAGQMAGFRQELERQGHVVFETVNFRRDGSSFPVLIDMTLVRDRDGAPRSRITYALDLTELKHAEEGQRKSSALLRTLIDTIPDLVWLKDAAGRYLECNSRFERYFGAAKADIVGRSDDDFVAPELANFFREHDRRAMAAGGPTMNEEEITFADDGHRESLETLKTPILDADGQLLGVLGIGRDITRRKLTEERLRVSEEKFHQIFHAAPLLASLSSREDGLIIDVNERYCQALEYTRDQVVGRTSLELGIFSAGERALLLANLAATNSVQNLELTAHTRTGRAIPCLFSAQAIRVGSEFMLVVMGLDISERKRAEATRRQLDAELHQVQKLDSLGSLAGGVAHDMNNVLAAIQAVTETLRDKHLGDADLCRALGIIDKASTRGRDLVRGLTNFARKDLREPEPLDLNALVREEMELLSRTTLQKVRLVMDLEQPLRPVLGERGTLGSALMNLCVNAIDAMPGGGTLTLRTRNLADGMVAVAVEDSGEGMAPAVLTRAMEPFFTTKPLGKGTGLGLSMAYTTAKTHGGNLALQSEPGKGTTVVLRLPALAGSPQAGEPAPADPLGTGSRRILLVDDDELILAAMPAMIEAQGHRVVTASGGPAALALLAAGAQVDLVVLDLNMPGMNGAETLRTLRRTWPGLPVILATGFLDDQTCDLLRGDPRTLSLLKPYSMVQLLRKFQEF